MTYREPKALILFFRNKRRSFEKHDVKCVAHELDTTSGTICNYKKLDSIY